MYLTDSVINGLKIMAFDKETMKKVSREKSLEEIFLSTLFLNYIIVLVVFLITLFTDNISFGSREINPQVFFGFLMIYPFVFNIKIYALYGFFGIVAELLNKHKKVKPLISVGFHTGIVYAIIMYMIGLISTFSLRLASFFVIAFLMYFLVTMFVSISAVYQYSLPQILIVMMIPIIMMLVMFGTILSLIDLHLISNFIFF